MWFARGGRRGAEGAAQVGLARSDVGHGVPRQERVLKAISGFQSRESYRRPPALMTASRHLAPAAGVTLASAWGPQRPAARLMPAAGFFFLSPRRRQNGWRPPGAASAEASAAESRT